MKILIIFSSLFLLSTKLLAANPFETISESKERHRAETYQARQNNSNPLYESHGTFGDPGGDASNRSRGFGGV